MSSPVLNQAARVLRLALAGTPADQALRESLTQDRHFNAPVARREITRAVFAYFRWWRWLSPAGSLQKQAAAALELQARFDRNPAAFKVESLAARAVPAWTAAEMTVTPGWLRQLQRAPALWIRARRGLETKVASALSDCTPASPPVPGLTPSAFRYGGVTDLYRTAGFRAGEFEIQDLASQLVGHACAPRPGETWWDACAGEGGKTLHLADLMENRGLVWASDRSLRRLTKLKERAARAKVFNYRTAPWEGGAQLPTRTRFDGVLVDAPCSGVGTWQRNPHARWTTQPTDVRELSAVQSSLLHHVAGAIKPGGRLLYAVCTLTHAETSAVADAFTAAHPEFQPISVAGIDARPVAGGAVPGRAAPAPNPPDDGRGDEPRPESAASVFLRPEALDANGMFIAAWRRR